jgi:2-methylcitrate dehydratase PrpD
VSAERQLVSFIRETSFHDLPAAVVGGTKDQLLADFGTAIAGAWAEGCETVVAMAKEAGGTPEATVLVHGGKVLAQHAAFVNGVMARALDYCDAAVPGAHAGTAIFPAALAAAELVGGVSGAGFLTAVAVGTEVALRMNLGEAEYDGFDPTGVCVPFGSTAAAAKLMGLSEAETWNALGLAFCRCGGSFQANVDGALAVRVIEGWVAETGVLCARLAGRGITGPADFLEGIYGYLHLFGRDRVTAASVVSGLGTTYHTGNLVFKKFPSCGATQGCTQVILDLMADEGFGAADVERIEITVPPYIHKLVGHPFRVGSNPKVNAQFSIRYCVANALVRKAPRLAHFEVDAISDPEVLRLAEKVEVLPDAALDLRGHTALDMRVVLTDSRVFLRGTDVAPGFPECPLSREEHLRRFNDCLEFAERPMPARQVAALVDSVGRLEEAEDIRDLLPLLVRATFSTT